jgi:hypothetical protein
MHVEAFYLCYNTKQMQQYGYWKRQRGLANSKSLEIALYGYKGKVPKNMPKNRMYVDAGSSLFNQVVKNVPVLPPKHQAFVSRAVRETSLISMVGIPHNEDDGEKEKQKLLADDDDNTELNQPDGADQQNRPIVAAQVKKRKLYRQLSGTDVPWFPHDNDMELMKELCWEAGRPRWVIHGTPAGGAGVHGCLEAGCSVVALCYNDHHRTHLNKFFLERAVEAMVTGTTLVFKDETLQARSVELNLTTAAKAASANQTPKLEEKDSEDEKDIETTPKNIKKKEKAKGKVTPKKKGAASVLADNVTADTETSSDSDSSSSDETEAPTKKKTKTN